jgi:hypothetical protein
MASALERFADPVCQVSWSHLEIMRHLLWPRREETMKNTFRLLNFSRIRGEQAKNRRVGASRQTARSQSQICREADP